MRIKEQILRKVNARIQNSNASKETKIHSQNIVFAMDISKRLAEITVDKTASYMKALHINNVLHDIWRSLEVF